MDEKTLERKWEGKLFLSVFGWVAMKENKWWGPGVFFLLCVCVCARNVRVCWHFASFFFFSFFFFSPLNDAFFFFSFFRCPRLKVEHCLFSSSFYYYYYYYYYYLAVSVIVVLFFFFFFCLIRHDFFK